MLLSGGGDALLADFGLSRPSEEGSAAFCAGSKRYMAPEMLARASMTREALAAAPPITPTADVWSLGVLLHEMLCGATRGAEAAEALAAGAAWVPGALPPETQPFFSPLLRLMLTRDPEARPDCSALLQHAAMVPVHHLVHETEGSGRGRGCGQTCLCQATR